MAALRRTRSFSAGIARSRGVFAVLMAALSLLLWGCGKSAPPIQDEKAIQEETRKAMDRMVQDQMRMQQQQQQQQNTSGPGVDIRGRFSDK